MSKSSNSLRQLHPHSLLSPSCEKLKQDLNRTLAWKWSDYETAHSFSRKLSVWLFKMLFTLILNLPPSFFFFFTRPEWSETWKHGCYSHKLLTTKNWGIWYKGTHVSYVKKKPTLKYLRRMSEKLDPLTNQPSGTISVCSHWITRLLSSLRLAA